MCLGKDGAGLLPSPGGETHQQALKHFLSDLTGNFIQGVVVFW